MKIAVIGSVAANYRLAGMLKREPADIDLVGSLEDVQKWVDAMSKRDNDPIVSVVPTPTGKIVFTLKKTIIEAEITWPGSSAEKMLKVIDDHPETFLANGLLVPPLRFLLGLKMTHRFLKNSPAFLKTMNDIIEMKKHTHTIEELDIPEDKALAEFLKEREKETYTYNHPKLNVSKDQFFNGDGVTYYFDHDQLHEYFAIGDEPAYKAMLVGDVNCSKDTFFSLGFEQRLNCVVEESIVLAYERCVVPCYIERKILMPIRPAYRLALNKVCTSITSGWFREFAWNHYYEALAALPKKLSGIANIRKGLTEGKLVPNEKPEDTLNAFRLARVG